MTTQSIDDFLTQALENGGDLSPEQAAQLLQMEMGAPGDTSTPEVPDTSNGPAVAPAQTDATATSTTNAPETPPAEAELTAENAVILAKDGKHTISYDKLLQERAARQAMAAQLEAANQKLAELQAQAQARAEAGQAPTLADNNAVAAQAAIDAGVDPAIFGDFSPEAMAAGVAKLVQAQVEARMAAIDAKLQPIQQQTAKTAEEKHITAIYGAHPDADSIVESQEFASWKAAQPSVVRAALDQAMSKGSATDVIEVFSAFKASKGQAAVPQQPAAPAAPQVSPAEAAKAAIAKAAAPMPASLSDIPGGRAGGTNLLEAMDSMNGPEMLSAANGMSQEQIEAWLNSQI